MAKTIAKAKTSGIARQVVPLGDRVLIETLEQKGESKTASGFILPGKEGTEKHEKGIIVSTGPGRLSSDGKRLAMEIKKGDTVLFKRGYDAEVITIKDVEHILMSESNVLAVER